jgi:AcrR family transcriptional regulator
MTTTGGPDAPPGTPAPADDHRRGRILAGLTTCIAEKGYNATTISDIARAARVSKTVVYAHFRGGKEEILLELYSRATDGVLAVLRAAAEQAREAGLPWRRRIEEVARAYLGALAAAPALARALLVEVQAVGHTALPMRRQVLDRYVDVLAGIAAELAGERPDEVRPVSRGLLVAAVGGINEVMLARVERGEAAVLAEDAELAAAVLVGQLERRP